MHYLIAGSLRDAKLTAEVDLKWRSINRVQALYLNEAGEEVKIVDAENFIRYGFRGLRGFTLYLGYGWHRLPRELKTQLGEMAPVMEIKIVELA